MEEKQLSIFPSDEKRSVDPKTCAFTGHRQLGEDFDGEKLKKIVQACVEAGVRTFYNGMAMGFDLVAAQCVLDLKEEFPDLRLIGCVPYFGQEKNYPEAEKEKYVRILKECDETVTLADRYFKGCALKRNAYMADRADVLIAYCRKSVGGTAFTLKYFRKKGGIICEM